MHFSLRLCLQKSCKARILRLTSSSRTMVTEGSGNFDDYPYLRNCETETGEPVSGTITGTIPSWLQGELVRVGPGIQKVGNDYYRHLFDGLAILHKFTVKGGKAFYQSRILQSDAYKENMEANRIVVSEFGTFGCTNDPCQSLFGRMKTEFNTITSLFKKPDRNKKKVGTDNCAVNVAFYGDQLYAMTETDFVRRVDPSTLNVVGEKTIISDHVAVNSATAHPHVLEDGSIINIGNKWRHAGGPHYCFIKVPPSYNSEKTSFANAKVIGEIPSRWKIHTAYFHSFGITTAEGDKSAKLIFIEYPYCLNVLGIAAGNFLQKSYCDWMTWYPKEKARIYILSLEDGKRHPVIYETEDLFLFHHINAFEQDGELIVDVAGYSDAEWVAHITRKDTRTPGKISEKPFARRYILPLNIEQAKPGENLVKMKSDATAVLRNGSKDTVDLTPQNLSGNMVELPRINYAYNGKKYTYFYGLGEKERSGTYDLGLDIIHKINVDTGEKISWIPEKGVRVSEPIFVADPTKVNPAEDDGVILTALLPSDNPTSVSLLILNAHNMSEIGRAEFTAKSQVTGTFHGLWAKNKIII